MNKRLTLNENNATITERMEEIYLIWDVNVKEARNIIRKIYYKEFNKLTNISEQRLILHNLVCSELESEGYVTNSAKLWAKTLLDFLNGEPKFIETNIEDYAKAMNNYLYTHKGELSNDELKSAHKQYYKIFEKYKYEDNPKYYMEKLISIFNLSMIEKEFNKSLKALKGLLIHSNDSDYMTAFEYCANELKEENEDLYNQILLLSKDNIRKTS